MGKKMSFLAVFISCIFLYVESFGQNETTPQNNIGLTHTELRDSLYLDSLKAHYLILGKKIEENFKLRKLDLSLVYCKEASILLDTMSIIDTIYVNELAELIFLQGTITKLKGEFTLAINLFNEYIARFEKLNINSSTLGLLYSNLANVYLDNGDFKLSMEKNMKALEILPDTSCYYYSVLNGIANLYEVTDNLAEANRYYSLSLANVGGIYGSNSIQSATLLINKSKIEFKLTKNANTSLIYLDSADKIIKGYKGVATEQLILIYNHYGFLYSELKRTDSAIQYYMKAHDLIIKVHGEEHFQLSTIYRNLSNLYREAYQTQRAMDYIGKAITTDKLNFGENHYNMALNYNNMASLFYDLKERKKSKEYYSKAYAIMVSLFGKDHSETKLVYDNLMSD
jgi:tetratricopeptide (TPR) repeat protein